MHTTIYLIATNENTQQVVMTTIILILICPLLNNGIFIKCFAFRTIYYALLTVRCIDRDLKKERTVFVCLQLPRLRQICAFEKFKRKHVKQPTMVT